MARSEKGNTEGENILCPLFISFTSNAIRCASHVPDCNTVELRYRDSVKCDKQRRLYCEGVWNRCEQYLSWEHWWNWKEEKAR